MYKQVETDESFETDNGGRETPVATLADECGGRTQIAVDDHCYVLYNGSRDRRYGMTHHIYREAFEVLKTLPAPE